MAPLNCLVCHGTSNHKGAICWKEGLCGKCWRLKHHTKPIKQTYDMCICGGRKVRLNYQKNGYNKTKNKYCPECRKVYIYDERHIVVIRGLCHKCFKSNSEIMIIKGVPICLNCNT